MGARRFGPDTARFLQRDAYNGATADLGLALDPLTQNRYALAGGNPISFMEWDGHLVLKDGGGGGGCECDMEDTDQTDASGAGSAAAAVVVAGTMTDATGPTEQIRINQASGRAWQSQVRGFLEAKYDPARYEIVENKAIRNEAGQVVRINDKRSQPDFQVVNRASGRIAAVYEAKIGQVTYLSGAGEGAQLFRYSQALGQVGYSVPDVIRIYELADEGATPRLSRATSRVGRLGNALDIIGLVLGVAADAATEQRYQESLDWLQVNDPEYYEQIDWMQTRQEAFCG